MKGPAPLDPIVGESLAIQRARELIDRYAPTALSVLLVGATGTGKELLARHIHARSGRRGRFVGVNCGVLPREMADGLLFGHERGAFSGAVKRHRGHVECADGGTLFLDELLSLSPDVQAKLLRALDTGEIQRLGEESERYVDVRVVGAVQEDVEERLARREFRPDLYQRIAGVVIDLPPLIDRPEDVVPLAAHFAGLRGQTLDQGTWDVLARHEWPGNVRELRHVIDRAGCRVENGTLPPWAVREAIALGTTIAGRQTGPRDPAQLTSYTREGLVALFASHAWNVERIAAGLGVGRTTFFRQLRKTGWTFRGLRKYASYAYVRVPMERSTAASNPP
ncbi:MAG TPA: sigma 54-interacting transcriptional regulator [Gemmatimonadales bacterium]|nr:sigma 54-interacting transcriptional regulator [Gemmatimonadales bacterium]